MTGRTEFSKRVKHQPLWMDGMALNRTFWINVYERAFPGDPPVSRRTGKPCYSRDEAIARSGKIHPPIYRIKVTPKVMP